MSLERCLFLARGMGVPEPRARELCKDEDLQRCAAGLLPLPGESEEKALENFVACYGRSTSTERSP